MIRTLLRTSWLHIERMKFASFTVMGVLVVLFLTLFSGIQMVGFLRTQRDLLIEKTTYPLFLQEQFTLSHGEVQDFINHLETDVIAAPVQIISKEQALDLQITQDPSLMSILSGDNPLPDTLMIPLYHTDIELFWSSMDKHRQLFENPSSVEDIRKHLTGIQQTLKQIQTATYLVGVFLGLTALVMLLLLVFTIRSHLRRFHEEYTIGQLVGAEPYVFWLPHAVTMTSYLIISATVSGGIFLFFRVLL